MKNILTQNIDKYGIINLLIWVSIPVIIALCIGYNQDTHTVTNSTTTTTTTTTKKCIASDCPNNAVSGSSYCSIHKKGKTKKCAKCGIAIWNDETFCDDCLYGSILDSMNND